MAHGAVHITGFKGVVGGVGEFLRFYEFIVGRYLLAGTDLVELFDTLDGHQTFDVIDAILEEEILRGSHLEEADGLANIRGAVRNLTTGQAKPEGQSTVPDTEVPSLFNGEILRESGDAADPFGLGMAPLA